MTGFEKQDFGSFSAIWRCMLPILITEKTYMVYPSLRPIHDIDTDGVELQSCLTLSVAW